MKLIIQPNADAFTVSDLILLRALRHAGGKPQDVVIENAEKVRDFIAHQVVDESGQTVDFATACAYVEQLKFSQVNAAFEHIGEAVDKVTEEAVNPQTGNGSS